MHTAEAAQIKDIEQTHNNCKSLPLTMFELWYINGDLQGMSEEHWDRLYEEYIQLSDAGSMKQNISDSTRAHTLQMQLNVVYENLHIVEQAYRARARYETALQLAKLNNSVVEAAELEKVIEDMNADLPTVLQPVIELLQKRFERKKLSFSCETWDKDAAMAISVMKTTQNKLREAMEIMQPSESGEIDPNCIDEALVNYHLQLNCPLPDKNQLNTAQFAIMMKAYKKHIETLERQMQKQNGRGGYEA